MIDNGNGEKEIRRQGLWREQEAGNHDSDPNSGKEFRPDGRRVGAEPIGAGGANSQRINRDQSSGQKTLGGMLSQLRELQQSHLAYVKNHEKRLRARLAENLDHQQIILEKMKVLEAAIVEFVAIEPTTEPEEKFLNSEE